MSMTFQKFLEANITEESTLINVMVYCHDDTMIKYLTLTRFGISMEYCVREIKPIENADKYAKVKKLSNKELVSRWNEVWPLLKLIIDHLKESPIFWFGDDYTEEGYYEFLQEEDTSVFVLEDNKKIIGLIESNADQEGFLLNENGYNVSEAVLFPEYRGKGFAEALLSEAEKDLLEKGIAYDWVNHGTCNPNACGFWDKYFTPYTFQFERQIRIKK